MKITLILLVLLAGCDSDDTDPPNGRSGMVLRTDTLTGCQYLYANGLTPHIDTDGKTHIGCRGAK
jgi:hypothetical protein